MLSHPNIALMKTITRAYNGIRDFVDVFSNSSTSHKKAPISKKNREAWYAEWDDNYLSGILNSKVVNTAFKKIADSFYGEQLNDILKDASMLTNSSFPNLNDVYSDCCTTLGMCNPPKAYVTSKIRGINALSVEVCNMQLILISPDVAIRLSEKEQKFLLGHEISHHQQGNLVCHTVNGLADEFKTKSEIMAPLVLDAIEVPLKRWCRCSEFNADRGGYLCCKDMNAVRALFNKIGDMEGSTAYAKYMETEAPYPLLETRFQTLSAYSNRIKTA